MRQLFHIYPRGSDTSLCEKSKHQVWMTKKIYVANCSECWKIISRIKIRVEDK